MVIRLTFLLLVESESLSEFPILTSDFSSDFSRASIAILVIFCDIFVIR